MLKMYRIIPLVFILFLFGFTFITVAPVFAQTACPLEGEPGHYGGKKGMCAQNPNARSYQECMGRCNASTSPSVAPTAPSGGEVAELNAKISGLEAGLGEVAQLNAKISGLEARLGEVAQLNAKISGQEAGLTELKGVVRTLQEQSKNSMQPVAPTAPSGGAVAPHTHLTSGDVTRGPYESTPPMDCTYRKHVASINHRMHHGLWEVCGGKAPIYWSVYLGNQRLHKNNQRHKCK
jgi:hypothetical protein